MAKTEEKKQPTVLVEFPVGELDQRYAPDRIDMHLDWERARTLRRMMNGAYETGAMLKEGRPVVSAADMVRWLLDEAARAGGWARAAEGK